jgi:hypothetical protein
MVIKTGHRTTDPENCDNQLPPYADSPAINTDAADPRRSPDDAATSRKPIAFAQDLIAARHLMRNTCDKQVRFRIGKGEAPQKLLELRINQSLKL